MLRPLYITAALALGLASGAALAQAARVSTAGTPGSATTAASPSTSGTTSTTGTSAARVGGCSGSNGSSCAATNSSTGTSSGDTVTTPAFRNSTLDTNQVQAPTTSSATSTAGLNPAARPALENPTNVDPALTRPDPFAPGGAFGAVPVPPVAETNGVANGSGIVIPEGAQTGNQQNVFVQPQTRPSVTVLNTPLFDQAAREGRAKESRRRAAGNEPRVYGIAPRTDRDLTWQMPDDPIIRY